MAAITDDRDTLAKYDPRGFRHQHIGADSTQFFKGGLVGILNATGKLNKVTAAAANIQVVGICEENVLTGASNTRRIKCRSGVFQFVNGDTITAAHVGQYCYAADDQTVNKAGVPSTDPIVGTIYDVDSAGVWVSINYPGVAFGGTGLTGQFSG